MKLISLFLISILLLAASCNKEYLPEFYFSCKVNGQKYEPDYCANCNTTKLLGDTTLIIGANRGFEAIALGVKDLDQISPKVFFLNHLDLQNKGGRGTYKNSVSNIDNYDTDTSHTGQLTITTLDKVNKIIAGTFYFEGFNVVQNKTVKITEGKFRLQYTTN